MIRVVWYRNCSLVWNLGVVEDGFLIRSVGFYIMERWNDIYIVIEK